MFLYFCRSLANINFTKSSLICDSALCIVYWYASRSGISTVSVAPSSLCILASSCRLRDRTCILWGFRCLRQVSEHLWLARGSPWIVEYGNKRSLFYAPLSLVQSLLFEKFNWAQVGNKRWHPEKNMGKCMQSFQYKGLALSFAVQLNIERYTKISKPTLLLPVIITKTFRLCRHVISQPYSLFTLYIPLLTRK